MKCPIYGLGCLLILLAAACKQDREIKVYRVAREAAPGAEAQPSPGKDPQTGQADAASADPHAGLGMPPTGGGTAAAAPHFTDTAPEHWKKQALSSMRLASYRVEGEDSAAVDISFTTLRRAGGGLLANVNRWRDQLGQAPIDEATLKQTAQTINTSFGEGIVVDVEGKAAEADATKDGRIVGVIAETANEAWYFKMRGNAALAGIEKENFFKWVGSVKPAAGEEPATPTPPPAPAATAPPAAVPAEKPPGSPPAAGAGVTWQLPDGWKQAAAAGSMRYATITVGGADGATAEVVVSHFPGDVGGDLENVNRWRQQAAVAPVDAAGLAPLISHLTAGPETLSLIDVTGPKQRLIAAWTRHGPDTWFFKLTGPEPLVAAEKAKFTAFVESIRFTQPES